MMNGQLSSSSTWSVSTHAPFTRCWIPLSVIRSQWDNTCEGGGEGEGEEREEGRRRRGGRRGRRGGGEEEGEEREEGREKSRGWGGGKDISSPVIVYHTYSTHICTCAHTYVPISGGWGSEELGAKEYYL